MSPGVPTGTPDELFIMEPTFVFVDAGYLSLILKHFGDGKYLKIDYNQLAITFAKSKNLWVEKAFYYTAPPYQSPSPNADEARRKANYDRVMVRLKRIPNFIVREGRVQKVDGKYTQKGVDTLLTMDLLSIPIHIKTVVLLACDTDFVPILNKLRSEQNIKIILFYFNDFIRKSKFAMSNHILTVCDECVLITKEHFEKSFLKF